MKKFVSLFKKPGVLIGMLIATFLACAIVIIALFMGQEAGHFVIQVESGDVRKSVKLTESLEDKRPSSRLEAPSLSGMTNTTYDYFYHKLSDYHNAEGLTIDEDLHIYAYSFYVINDSAESVEVKSTLYLSNVTKNLDKGMRVMTLISKEGAADYQVNGCYQAPDEVEPSEAYGSNYPAVTEFVDKDRVFEERISSFDPDTYIKYTVIFWIEGKDPDTTDDLWNGSIRFTLKLSIL
ncbi:MAG: hypothetical protein K2H02_00305 [Anaeroplasmataceae bacterium]|nr:hypothetical protein [Anaeroplasmataceae bacterium]MDE5867366.1 hypothetical protein [Anaeroplasmataceae bacterium]